MDVSNLHELGALIKAYRERKGLLREDIALRIKVSVKTLNALEEGLVDALPQPVFARGFVRAYANALGMNMHEIDPMLEAAFPAENMSNISPDMTSAAREQAISINRQGSKISWFIVFVILLVLAGGGIWLLFDKYGYNFFQDSRRPSSQVISVDMSGGSSGQASSVSPGIPSEEANSGLVPEASLPVPGVPSGGAGSGVAASNTDTTMPQTAAVPVQSQVQASSPRTTSDAQPVPSGSVATPNHGVAPSAGNRLVITASADCWVGASYDEDGKRDAILRPGQSMSIAFNNGLKLILGNAGGIKLIYNGKDFPFSAGSGEAKVLYFPPTGRP